MTWFLAQSTLTPRGVASAAKTIGSRDLTPFLIGAGAVLVAVFLAYAIHNATTRLRDRRNPLLLFYDLAALHRLPRGRQRRLLKLARKHYIADPAYLFVCPDLVRQIQTLEASQAKNAREQARNDAFFQEFQAAVFRQ